MSEMDVTSSVASDLTTQVTDYSVDPQNTDGPTDQKETHWMNTEYAQYLGYYKSIPELAAVVDAKAAWTVGLGFIADKDTTFILERIRGINGESFDTIMENMVRTQEIGGDSYAEIIRDEQRDLLNLKPLDPEVMRHVANKEGMLTFFDQMAKAGKGKKNKVEHRFKINEIFYLPRNRVGDEIHGNCMTQRLANIILARNEAMEDQKEVFHRFVKPRWIIKLSTDQPTEIATEKAKWDKANEDGENMYIPMGSVEVEQMAISPNSTLNPQTWIDNLNSYFYEAANCPKIIVGGSGGFTDAAVKVAYVAYEQNIKAKSRVISKQIGLQLGMDVKFKFPASLINDLLSDASKDGQESENPLAPKPSDVGVSK